MTMPRSADRILTTHTGSLPRPPDLEAMLLRKEHGAPEPGVLLLKKPYRRRDLAEAIRRALDRAQGNGPL